MSEWEQIATAPKDGTWIIAYRPRPAIAGYLDRVVVVRWDTEVSAWVWPNQPFDIYEEDFDERLNSHSFADRIDPFEDRAFTHWLPIPKDPLREAPHA